MKTTDNVAYEAVKNNMVACNTTKNEAYGIVQGSSQNTSGDDDGYELDMDYETVM